MKKLPTPAGCLRAMRLTLGIGAILAVAVLRAESQMIVSEIHYNPPPPTTQERSLGFDEADDFEFIEFANVGTTAVSIQGCALLAGVEYNFIFSPIATLAPGAKAVVVENVNAFRARYGAGPAIAGKYSGKLSNNGELLVWRNPAGAQESFEYSDTGVWTELADGLGWSLQRRTPIVAAASPTAWRCSVLRHGSPGAEDRPPSGIMFNEVLSHTDPPLVDSIEICNISVQAVDISGWWISDDKDMLQKYSIPAGTVLASGGYLVITETQFRSPSLPPERQFGLDAARGDDLFLGVVSAGSARLEDEVSFGAQYNGESVGRWPNGNGAALHPLIARTLGGPNAAARVPRIAITELHYAPAAPNADLEYIEICNLESLTVSLNHWTINQGVELNFPAGKFLSPGEVAVVVPFNPNDAAVRTRFINTWAVPLDVQIIGVSSGRLSDVGEYVTLAAPDDPPTSEPTFHPEVAEDRVAFWTVSPWPGTAAGQGHALHRLNRRVAGTWATAWGAATPSPGRAPMYDEDGDSVSDAWELRHFGSRFTSQGAASDADGDGASDYDEWVSGTLPLNAASRLAVTQVVFQPQDGLVRFTWPTVTNVQYRVEQAPSPTGSWTQAAAQGVTNAAGSFGFRPVGTSLYYRVRVESAPP